MKKVLTLTETCAILDVTCERGFFVVRFFAFQATADRSRQGGSRPSLEEGEYKEVPKECEYK